MSEMAQMVSESMAPVGPVLGRAKSANVARACAEPSLLTKKLSSS